MCGKPNKPISVMLVDEHQIVLEALETLIESRQPLIKVVAISDNYIDALNKARIKMPDIIVHELMIGDHDMLEALPELVGQSGAYSLILTSSSDQAVFDRGIVKGARGVVRKKQAPAVLFNAIEKIHDGQLWLDRESTARIFETLHESKWDGEEEYRKFCLLTPKEYKVVEAVIDGFGASNKEIAKTIFMSEATFRNHLTSIYYKLQVENRSTLYMYATKLRIKERISMARTKTSQPGRHLMPLLKFSTNEPHKHVA